MLNGQAEPKNNRKNYTLRCENGLKTLTGQKRMWDIGPTNCLREEGADKVVIKMEIVNRN